MTKPIPSRVDFLTENEKGDPKGRLAKPRKLVPEARVELARRETTVFETAASAIPPLGHISLHSITEARIRVHDKIAPRLALLSPAPRPPPPVFRFPHPAPAPPVRLLVLALPRTPARSSRLPAPRARQAPRDLCQVFGHEGAPWVSPNRVPSAFVQPSSSFRESRDCGLFASCALG